MQKKEIIILGAGISGLTAAIKLRQAGIPVKVYEQTGMAGGTHKNGDFEGLENWTEEKNIIGFFEENKITTDFIKKPFNFFTVYDYKSRRYCIKDKNPIFYLVERGGGKLTIDTALLEQAKSLGAKIEFNKTVPENMADIIAKGYTKRKFFAVGLGYKFNTNAIDQANAVIDNNIAPNMYAYLLVMGGQGVVVTCVAKNMRYAKKYLDKTVERFKLIAPLKMWDMRYFAGVGSVGGKFSFGKNKIYIGEAAGFQDALFGFGMVFAVKSGILAARSIADKEDYYRLVHKEIIPFVKNSLRNRIVYGKLGNMGYSYCLKKISKSKVPRKKMRLMYGNNFYKIFY